LAQRIEPPVLLSRLMTFVFAGALVAAVVLVVTLIKLYPLSKTQVFFLTTQPRSGMDIHLTDFAPNDNNLEIYKQAFVKEYIKARNEIIPNAGAMRRKWDNRADGLVYMWSSPNVYNAFMGTGMWVALMHDLPDFEISCRVEFTGIPPPTNNTYLVSFRYFCGGQEVVKDYTIKLRIETEDTIKWSDRLQNPLGIRVVEYSVQSGDGDPLDW
jgi:type IV secretory pathway component VirB8